MEILLLNLKVASFLKINTPIYIPMKSGQEILSLNILDKIFDILIIAIITVGR